MFFSFQNFSANSCLTPDLLNLAWVWFTDIFQWVVQWSSLTMASICLFYVLFLKPLGCINPKSATKVRKIIEYLIVKFFERLLSGFTIFRGKSKQELLFIPNADKQFRKSWWDYFKTSNQRNGVYEISQDALTRYLLNQDTADIIDNLNSDGAATEFRMNQMMYHLRDIKKESQITEFSIYRSSMHWLLDTFGIYHTFIVFKTISEKKNKYWWSLEKNIKNIVIQNSRNKFAVLNRLKRKDRKNVQLISTVTNDATNEEKSTMSDLLTTLWAHNVIPEKYHVVKSSCQTFVQFMEKAYSQSFVNFVGKRHMTSFEPIVPYTFSPEKNAEKQEPFIKLLTKFPEWEPLFAIIYLGDPVVLENLLCNPQRRHTDVNLVAYGTSPLQLAILFSRTKMVEILLRNPRLNLTTREDENSEMQNENSEMPWKDMSIFHTAAAFTNDTQIIDLLEKNGQVKNDPDAEGRTALHIAVMESNETTVSHLLKNKLTDPNASDSNGLSPLHLAAQHTDNTKIIDLIYQAKKAQKTDRGIDDCDTKKNTALHHAVNADNVTTARHLMELGANPNQGDKDGRTPLELAAKEAKDMKMVELFLNNEKVCKELKEKGGDPIYTAAISNENDGVNSEIDFRLRSKGIIRKQQIPPKKDPPKQLNGSNPDPMNKKEKKKEKKGKKALEEKKSPDESKDMPTKTYFETFCAIL